MKTDHLGNVKQKIDGKQQITIKGKRYVWNTVYKVYNCVSDYSQLKWRDLE